MDHRTHLVSCLRAVRRAGYVIRVERDFLLFGGIVQKTYSERQVQ